jgi:hypothetical protein
MPTTSVSVTTPVANSANATGYMQADGFCSPTTPGSPVGTNGLHSVGPAKLLAGTSLAGGFVYGTNTATAGATLTAANIYAVGAVDVTLNMTGTLAGAANAQLPTVASLVTLIANPIVGQTYRLRVINSSSGNFAWTVTTNTGWTLAGTMTIAQNTFRDFNVTLTSLTAATLQSVGTGTNS